MEYHDDTKRRKVFIVLGVVLAVVAGGAAFFLVNQAQTAGNAAVATRQVVVAARDLPVRTVIEASDVTVRSVPEDPSVASAYTTPEEVVGRITGAPILFQQPFTPNLLTSTTAGSGFSILGPEETVAPDSPIWRAVAVYVPDERAVAGQIQVGQRVDLLLTAGINVVPEAADAGGSSGGSPGAAGNGTGSAGSASPSGAPGSGSESTGTGAATPSEAPYYSDRSTKISYQNIVILAKTGQLYIIKVDLNQAEEINHLAAAGSATFSMVLRPEGDDRTVDTTDYGETTNQIIEKYELPIPQVYPIR
jgi:Flp pilus assembly protein CpaB